MSILYVNWFHMAHLHFGTHFIFPFKSFSLAQAYSVGIYSHEPPLLFRQYSVSVDLSVSTMIR